MKLRGSEVCVSLLVCVSLGESSITVCVSGDKVCVPLVLL